MKQVIDRNKERLYKKALKKMNKQAKKRGIQFSFVKPVKEVEDDNR